ncbi:MAG: PepSY domain-containing protein [Aureispira sp.]
MSQDNARQYQVQLLRQFRKWHRLTGAGLFVFFFVVGITGLVLGWKKNSQGYILPKTQKGSTKTVTTWLPLDSLQVLAQEALQKAYPDYSTKIARLDVRPSKGLLKVLFEEHHVGVQLDGATGGTLSVAKRHSDWLENLHDGSLVDDWLGTKGYFKLFYTTIMGLALLLFTITGFWLWYGPKRLRKNR